MFFLILLCLSRYEYTLSQHALAMSDTLVKLGAFSAELELPAVLMSTLELHKKLLETKRANNELSSVVRRIRSFAYAAVACHTCPPVTTQSARLRDNLRALTTLVGMASKWQTPDSTVAAATAELCITIMNQLGAANQLIDAMLANPDFLF